MKNPCGWVSLTSRDFWVLRTIAAYYNFYNRARFHQSLDYSVPDEMYKSFIFSFFSLHFPKIDI